MIDAPVLLIIYKRPDHTRRALELIARARPPLLFVAADGPRTQAEAAACTATRALVEEYPGQVVTNFSETNLGCGVRVHTAISWAFESAERLLILEDDCAPSPSFFRFCNTLLERFADDERVMHVSGDNFAGEEHARGYGYYFSKYTHASGWATWRRAWRHFDWSLQGCDTAVRDGLIEQWHADPYERRYWREQFERLKGGDREIWDLQWNFSCWAQNGLAVLPARNLVENDGWGPDATHSKAPIPWPAARELEEISDPPCMVRNLEAESLTFDRNFGGAAMKAQDSPRARLRRRIAPLLGPARAARSAWRQLVG